MNNFEYIKTLDIDKMTEFVNETPCLHCIDYEKENKYCLKKCKQRIKLWLQQERVEDDTSNTSF